MECDWYVETAANFCWFLLRKALNLWTIFRGNCSHEGEPPPEKPSWKFCPDFIVFFLAILWGNSPFLYKNILHEIPWKRNIELFWEVVLIWFPINAINVALILALAQVQPVQSFALFPWWTDYKPCMIFTQIPWFIKRASLSRRFILKTYLTTPDNSKFDWFDLSSKMSPSIAITRRAEPTFRVVLQFQAPQVASSKSNHVLDIKYFR